MASSEFGPSIATTYYILLMNHEIIAIWLLINKLNKLPFKIKSKAWSSLGSIYFLKKTKVLSLLSIIFFC